MHTNARQEREQSKYHKGCTNLPKRIDRCKFEHNPTESCPSSNSQVESRVIKGQDHIGVFSSQVEETALLCKKSQRSQSPPNEEHDQRTHRIGIGKREGCVLYLFSE